MAQQQHHRFADANCILRINSKCPRCQTRMTEFISSIVGLYNVEIAGEEGIVKISGEVDPNIFHQAIAGARAGGHGEVIRARITHPEVNNARRNTNNASYISSNNGGYPSIEYGDDCNHLGYSGGQGVLEAGYAGGRGLYGGNSVHGGRPLYHDPAGCTDYCCRRLPEAEQQLRDDENWCTIM